MPKRARRRPTTQQQPLWRQDEGGIKEKAQYDKVDLESTQVKGTISGLKQSKQLEEGAPWQRAPAKETEPTATTTALQQQPQLPQP